MVTCATAGVLAFSGVLTQTLTQTGHQAHGVLKSCPFLLPPLHPTRWDKGLWQDFLPSHCESQKSVQLSVVGPLPFPNDDFDDQLLRNSQEDPGNPDRTQVLRSSSPRKTQVPVFT